MVTSQGNRPFAYMDINKYTTEKGVIWVNLQMGQGGRQEKNQFISMDYCAF